MLRLSVAVLALVATGSAQIGTTTTSASFTGVVETVPAVRPAQSVPCRLPGFQLQCANGAFYIQSSTVDLSALVGRNVKLFGTSLPQCPNIFEISRVEPPPVTLVQCGTPAFGCPIRLRSSPGALSEHWLFGSLSPGLFPLNLDAGSILLGPPFFLLGHQAVGTVQGAAFDLVIPVVPVLTGRTLYFQSARRDIGPVGPLRMSNAACLTILGFAGICHVPNC